MVQVRTGDAFHILFHFHIECVSSSGSLLAIWPVLHHLTGLYGAETFDTSQYFWNVTCRLTFDLTLVCHLQSVKPGWNHISFLLLGFLPRSLYDWRRHFRTLVKWQWCSQVMMETGVITHTIVDENTQSWMGFWALSSFGLFFQPWFCALVSVPIYSLFESNKNLYLHP